MKVFFSIKKEGILLEKEMHKNIFLKKKSDIGNQLQVIYSACQRNKIQWLYTLCQKGVLVCLGT